MKRICLATIAVLMIGLCVGSVFIRNCADNGILAIRTIEDIQRLDCNVNQIFTEKDVELFIADAENYFQNLSEDVEIYIVSPTNNIRQHNFTMTQEAEVVEVIRGDGIENNLLQIVTSGGVYDQKYSFHTYANDRPVFYGMSNLLLPGNQYLVFLKPLKTNAYTETKRYNFAFALFSSFNLTSDFSLPVDKPIDEVAYNDFGNSEYLCDSPKTLEHILHFKEYVINLCMTSHSTSSCSGKVILYTSPICPGYISLLMPFHHPQS